MNFGDETPPKITIYHWFTQFNVGRRLLKEEFKEDRLVGCTWLNGAKSL